MAVSPASYSNLDLTMSLHSSARDLDLNQAPSLGSEDEWITKTTTVEVFDEENIDGVVRPKKLRLTRKQSRLLEESFRQNNTLKPKQKQALALQLKLKPRQVEVWFQNRRARSKLKETEMECENLKRLLGSLTEQNLQLEAEVEKLKAMKAGSPTVISPHNFEPSTLKIMCPRCVCVTTISSINMEPSTPLSSKVATSALQSWPSSAAC